MQLHITNGINIGVLCGNTVLLYLSFLRVQVTLIAMVKALLSVGFATALQNPQCACVSRVTVVVLCVNRLKSN